MTRKPARERLLDAADDLLFVDGVVATPVDQVLRRAEVAPATLYAHFGSKDGLVAAALERRLSVWTQVWDDALAAAATPAERLLAVFDALVTYHDDRLSERWCAFSGTAAATRTPSDAVAERLAAETALLTGRLTDLAHDVLPGDPDGAAALTDDLIVLYCGTLALMLRRDAHTAMAQGRAAARRLVAERVGT